MVGKFTPNIIKIHACSHSYHVFQQTKAPEYEVNRLICRVTCFTHVYLRDSVSLIFSNCNNSEIQIDSFCNKNFRKRNNIISDTVNLDGILLLALILETSLMIPCVFFFFLQNLSRIEADLFIFIILTYKGISF